VVDGRDVQTLGQMAVKLPAISHDHDVAMGDMDAKGVLP